MRPQPPTGEQHEIRRGEHRAVVTELGGALRRYDVGDRAVIDGYGEDESPASGRGQVLAPWPNRVDGGQYAFGGATHQLPLTEVASGNASHGLLRWATWQVAADGAAAVVATATVRPQPGYPFAVRVRLRYALEADGLQVSTELSNVGADAAPVGLGFHPYVDLGGGVVDDVRLSVPARSWGEVDERGIPVARHDVAGTDRDFTASRLVGGTVLDTPYSDVVRDPDGRWRGRVVPPHGQEVVVWADETFEHLQVFTADSWSGGGPRSALAVEPMTCAPDAFNSGDGLVVLEPGQRLVGTWGIGVVEAAPGAS